MSVSGRNRTGPSRERGNVKARLLAHSAVGRTEVVDQRLGKSQGREKELRCKGAVRVEGLREGD